MSCSGKTLGSAAALKTSCAISPETWCWPWPSVMPPMKVETMTCGRSRADGEHGVVEDAVVAPLLEGLFLRLGEAEVDFGAPELLGAVVLVGVEEFVGAEDAEGVVEFAGHGVLAAFAAGEREERGADAQAAREIGEQGAVFVVGVGDDHHQAGGGAELL